ncbi:MAG TPA: hypothetical protein PKL77_11570 [Candidatus Omnitrophota bacterium]|nr:hypothetical protein [Candidatus Omnitrophota bacterium]HPR79307.1 hypothetical protein [Candidatus Limiplasma sp.]
MTTDEMQQIANIRQAYEIALENDEFEEDFKKSAMDCIGFLLDVISRIKL